MIEFNNPSDRALLEKLIEINLEDSCVGDLFANNIPSNRGIIINRKDCKLTLVAESQDDLDIFIKDLLQFVSLIDLLSRNDLVFIHKNPITFEGNFLCNKLSHLKEEFIANPNEFSQKNINTIYPHIIEYINSFVYVRNELREYVQRKFKTPEQIRFENQLNDANTKHKEAMCNTRWALGFSFVGLLTALILPFCTKTTLAEIDEIKQVIQSAKTEIPAVIETKITNDTIKVDVVKSTPIQNK